MTSRTVGGAMHPTGLNPVRAVLDNGVVIMAKETRKTPAVAINLTVRAGSVADGQGAAGAMHMLGRVIDRGTAHRSAAAIAEELEGRGILLTTNVNRHMFSIVCSCLTEDFEPVIALLGEMLTTPSVPDEEVGRRKSEVVTAIRQDDDNPAVRATDRLMAEMYGAGHPYGRRVRGTTESMDAIGRAALVDLHAAYFTPSNLCAVVVGDVAAEGIVDAVGRVFEAWRRPAAPTVNLSSPRPSPVRRRVVLPMMNKSQADVAYGFTTIKRSDPAYYAYWLMNNVLGQYALGGRLGDSIRERQGMAYYVSSTLDANVIEGPLLVRAGVSPANVDRTIASIDDELERARRDGFTEKELNESRQYLIGSLPRSLETNIGIASFLQTTDFFGLGLDHDRRLPELLGSVTLDAINDAAIRALDPSRATMVVAGPYNE
jgi:zinc protease